MKKSTLTSICSLLVAGALVAGVCCAGYASRNDSGKWFHNSDLKSWHWSDRSPAGIDGDNDIGNEPDDDINQGNEFADGDFVHNTEDNGIMFMSATIAVEDYDEYGIDAQADTAYSITATVNEDAVDKSVIGSIAWKNPDSEWATGKSVGTYASLNQTTEYGLDFTLTVKQAFGEPIVVKVVSCTDSSVYGTCQIDYLKKLKWFKGIMNSSLPENAAGRIYVGDSKDDGNSKNVVRIEPTYGVGTISGNYRLNKVEFTPNSYFRTNLKSALDAGINYGTYSPRELVTITPDIGSGLVSVSVDDLIAGGGDTQFARTITHNFICSHGCGDAGGTAAYTAGVTSIKYYITYYYGNLYSTDVTYTDDKSCGFRNDKLTILSTVSEINVSPNIIVFPD